MIVGPEYNSTCATDSQLHMIVAKRPRSYLISVDQGSDRRAWVQLHLCDRTRLTTTHDCSEKAEKRKNTYKKNYFIPHNLKTTLRERPKARENLTKIFTSYKILTNKIMKSIVIPMMYWRARTQKKHNKVRVEYNGGQLSTVQCNGVEYSRVQWSTVKYSGVQ